MGLESDFLRLEYTRRIGRIWYRFAELDRIDCPRTRVFKLEKLDIAFALEIDKLLEQNREEEHTQIDSA